MPPIDDPLARLAQLASHNPDEAPTSAAPTGFESDPLAAPPSGTIPAGQLQTRSGQPRANDPLQTLMVAQAQLALRRRPPARVAPPPSTFGLSAALFP